MTAVVQDVNAHRTIIGYAIDSLDRSRHGLIWKNGNYEFLKLKGYDFTAPLSINDSDVIVGSVGRGIVPSTYWPVVWKDGTGSVLPSLGLGGVAVDINRSGDIVGYVFRSNSNGSQEEVPAMWRAGKLSLLPAGGFKVSEAMAIDDRGVIYGFAEMSPSGDEFPVAWTEGKISTLPLDYGEDYHGRAYPRRATSGFASGLLFVNEPGSNTEGVQRAVAWENSAFRMLPNLSVKGETFSIGVNGSGEYAGVYLDSLVRYEMLPVIWSKDGLNLLPSPEGSKILALSLNDSGYVVGEKLETGSKYVPVVWDLAPKIAIDMANITAAPGETVQLRATATRKGSPQANQQVTFAINRKNIGDAMTNSNGVASLTYTVPSDAAGTILASAKATGTQAADGMTAIRHIIVGKSPSIAAVTPVAGRVGQKVELTASLRLSLQNEALTGKTVSFFVDGRSIGKATTDKSGLARTSAVIPTGTAVGGSIPVEVRYAGDAASKPSKGRVSAYITK